MFSANYPLSEPVSPARIERDGDIARWHGALVILCIVRSRAKERGLYLEGGKAPLREVEGSYLR
jgi:hypothetical protein